MRKQRSDIKLLKDGKASPDEIMFAQAKYLKTLHEYQGFSKKMNLPEQMQRVYMDGLGRKANSHLAKNMFKNNDNNGIIKSNKMFRKSQNTGAFKHLSERMSKKHIREIAKEFEINLDGLKLNIDYNTELLNIPLAGRADPEQLGGITFFPNSFMSKEELLRTIFHEKQHVEQFREYGVEYVQKNRAYFEELTEKLEDEFISRIKKEGRL